MYFKYVCSIYTWVLASETEAVLGASEFAFLYLSIVPLTLQTKLFCYLQTLFQNIKMFWSFINLLLYKIHNISNLVLFCNKYDSVNHSIILPSFSITF